MELDQEELVQQKMEGVNLEESKEEEEKFEPQYYGIFGDKTGFFKYVILPFYSFRTKFAKTCLISTQTNRKQKTSKKKDRK